MPGRFAALLGLLIFACFLPVVLGWETFFLVDYSAFSYPVAFYHRESFRDWTIPLWNPLNNCGVPFLAEWNTLVLYPFSFFYILLPMPWSFGFFCLGHLFLAGLGMYWLSCRWTQNRLAGAVAGTAFAFNGLMWYGLMWPSIITGMCWMPWVVLAMETAWQRGGIWIVPAALAAAMQLFTGAPEVELLTWLVVGVLLVERIGEGKIPQLVGRTLGAGGLAAGLAAAQLLPVVELVLHSSRSNHFGNSGVADIAAMPWTGWANFLVPRFHCVPGSHGVLYQAGQSWTASYYLGAGIAALALLGMWRVRHRRVWILTGLTFFSLLMALGSQAFVYDAVKRLVPPIQFIRFPVKYVMLAIFTLPLLAAYGLSHVLKISAENWRREWSRIRGLAGVLLGIMAGLALWAWLNPIEKEDVSALLINTVERAVFLVLILASVVWMRRELAGWRGYLPQVILMTLLWFDVFTHAPNLSPTVPSAVFDAEVVRHFFQWDQPSNAVNGRVMQSKEAMWRMLGSESTDAVLDTQARRLSLCQNLNLLDHVSKVDGVYSLDLKEFFDVFQRVYFTSNEAAGLKDFMGVTRINNPTNIVEWVTRSSALPLMTAGQKPIFADETETLKAVISDRFEPSRVVYLPEEARGFIQATDSAPATIHARVFSPHHLAAEVEGKAPTMLVVAQSYYHRWRAYVDEKPVRLWRANYAFQAVEVPAGRHQVRLAYEDSGFYWGSALSLLSIAICAAWGAIALRKNLSPLEQK